MCIRDRINNPSREATFEAIRRIKAAGGFFSFDPNLREALWSSLEEMKTVVMEAVALADVLKFSEEELTPVSYTHLDVYKRQKRTCMLRLILKKLVQNKKRP